MFVLKCTLNWIDRRSTMMRKYMKNLMLKMTWFNWHYSKVVPRGVGQKLHRPWKGPYRIVKQISDSVYRLQNPCSPWQCMTVHFDRLSRAQVQTE